MSDNIPFEIQIEIIKLLPIKTLLRFRQVSKSWKSLINSYDFIAKYHLSNSQLHHRLLVSYVDSEHEVDDVKYFSIVDDDDDDDDSFPRHKFPLIAPSDVTLLGTYPSIIGTSHGVFCLCNSYRGSVYRSSLDDTMTFVLWNPTIRKSIRIVMPMPNVLNNLEFRTVVGFGVCPLTNDPKLVKITYISSLKFMITFEKKCIPLQVELFSLSSRSWRSLSVNVPRKSIELRWDQVCIDKFIYWVATDRTHADEIVQRKNLILSFDMTTEEFTEINLPNNLAYMYNGGLFIYKLCTSLVVLETEFTRNKEYCVWRMEQGVPNSFTKLYVIKSPFESLQIEAVHEFWKTGEPIIEMYGYKPESEETSDTGIGGGINGVYVYKPESEEISFTGIASTGVVCLSYIETLLLLDQ